MKALSCCCLLLVLPLGTQAGETLVTLDGRTYRDCRIVRADPESLAIVHADGAARVPRVQLPEPWRQRWGYDRTQAQAHAREQARRQEAFAALRRQREAELGQALAEAQQRERLRLLGAAAQAQAERLAVAQQPWPPSVLPPALPDLGAVHAPSREFRRIEVWRGFCGNGAPFFPRYSAFWSGMGCFYLSRSSCAYMGP